jgi:hypothetical protein
VTTLTLNIDLADESGIQRAITALQRLLGNAIPTSAPLPAGAASKGTAPAGAARGQTAGASSPTAQSAAAASQASTAATGDTGNATGTAGGQTAGATDVSSSTPAGSPAPTFEEVKKAFIALSTKPNGRALCEGVLAPFKLTKLSEAKAEQYAAIKALIDKAAA